MALFKIFNNIDSEIVNQETGKSTFNGLPETYNKGYMYFDASKNLFYIDLAGEGGTTGRRVALNSYGAERAYADINGSQIDTTYLKISDYNPEISTLTIGSYTYDGSANVTIPVYDGTYTWG